MDNCLFCKIIRGEIPSTKVYEDENSFAFLSISPNNHGHTLVIPKKHFRNMLDMDEKTASDLALAVRKISKGVFEGSKAEGLNIIMNNESSAGQAVFHAHMHIIPRFTDDGLRSWEKNVPYENGEATQIAENIKAKIAQ
ncbi:MAG: HIT family protein [Candidatus Paceibacterota bacterium]|jgi:histidine triad (HIT) family protein|nr:HIT family protein [Candidatus Paceibacterota bacterium]